MARPASSYSASLMRSTFIHAFRTFARNLDNLPLCPIPLKEQMLARSFFCKCHGLGTRFKRDLSLAYQIHTPPSVDVKLENEPILIMHGLFGSKQNSRSISKALARDLKIAVYALDLRNHGESPHNPVHTYSSMADDVEQFMYEHSIKRPVLIGHSMGAKVAMTVALRSPLRIKALIPVDNAPVDVNLKSNFHQYVKGLRKVEESNVKNQAEADGVLKGYEKELAIRQFLLTNLVRSVNGQYLELRIPVRTLASNLGNMGDFPYKDPDVIRYDGPTLIIRGTKSHYVADDVLPLIGKFFPKFVAKDIDCGHWIVSEKPEEFRQAVVEFMQNQDPHTP